MRIPLLSAAPLILLAAACATTPPPPRIVEVPALPEIRTAPAPATADVTARPDDPFAGIPADVTVSLTAVDQDIRQLLTALAEIAEIDLVLEPDVQGRVTVQFDEVPVREAFREILAVSELGLAPRPLQAPYGPVVFHTFPLNVDYASIEQIMARWDVSREMAKWIVESRRR